MIKSKKRTVRNKYTQILKLDDLKKYAGRTNEAIEKTLINQYSIRKDCYEFAVMENYIGYENNYEVYIYISDSSNIASKLLLKNFSNMISAKIYYIYLMLIIKYKSFNKIAKIVAK